MDPLMHDSSGWVVTPGDPGSLADAIEDASRSPERRAASGENAGDVAERLTPRSVAQQLIEVYDLVTASSNAE